MFRALKNYKHVRNLRGLGDIEKLMNKMASSTLCGMSHVLSVTHADGAPLLEFRGHIYEPIYEYFDAACRVSAYQADGTQRVLFDETHRNVAPYRNETITMGSKEAVEEFIHGLGNIRIRVTLT